MDYFFVCVTLQIWIKWIWSKSDLFNEAESVDTLMEIMQPNGSQVVQTLI